MGVGGGRVRVCTQGTLGSSVKRALLFRLLPSRDQGGKYTGSPAPSPSLSENPPQTRPSEGPGFNHPLRRFVLSRDEERYYQSPTRANLTS